MLHENHGAEVAFRLVYIAEAHASDEWPIGAHIQQPQPRSTAERCGVARRRLAELGVARLPVLVDTAPDNAFGKAYASWPLRWFFLDGHTLTAVAQPTGGGGYDVRQLVSGLMAKVAEVRGVA